VEITTETVTTSPRSGQYVAEGAGSGIIVTQDGYIVTNNHVIDGASKITVRLKSGESYTATKAGTDAKTDIALLKIKATGLQPAVFGDSDKLKVGELAVAIGNPLGELGGTVTDGIISALDREIELDGETMNLLQTNSAINPGNSGGGLFNGSGELIGIVVAKSSGSSVEGLGFAIPINDAKSVIEQLMSSGYVRGRIDLGMTVVEVTDAQTAMAYRLQQLGLYVQAVASGSAAQSAGFQAGDCLVSLDGTSITTSAGLTKILDQHKVGDTVTLGVIRNGQKLSLSLQLAESQPA
jgi:serine protease Do